MSDIPDLDLKNSNDETAGICRDFQRGLCERTRCKYKHEKSNDSSIPTLLFCHDFQNNCCPRPVCKFIHCTVAEEEKYKRTGELAPHIQLDAVRKQQLYLGSIVPVCNNFLNGECRRANSCKFRHVTQSQYDMEMRLAIQNNPDYNKYPNIANNEQYIMRNMNNEPQNFFRNDLRRVHCDTMYNDFDEYSPPEPKRRFLVPNNIEFVDANGYRIPDSDLDSRSLNLKNYFKATQNRDLNLTKDARIHMLEEENLILHKQIVDLKKQVSDLTATNEFLLDQNAQFRVSNKRNQTNVTSVTVPAVTITNTSVPPNNTPTQPAQQVIRTVTASVATVPVSIATVTTGSPCSVSISGVSMAPIQALPAVSIAQPSAQIIAQNQQLLANPTPQITLANGSQAQLAIAQQNLANNLAAQQNQPITNQQLTSQAQQMALANNTQLTSQAQQMAHNTLTSQAQQIALANNTLTSQAQQIALANNTLTSQAQLLANNTQLTSQAQQLALASTPQLIAAQQNQMAAINTSQAIAMSNATQPLVSYPIMTQSVLQNGLGR